ncbi:MAG: EAL domain-containing protein [Shinella sp.]|nr:EAL domain-containing protein [Shinella sp.]
MSERSIFANLVREADGSYSTVYGPFKLQSALQPIFRETLNYHLRIDAFEGLIRASRSGAPCAPAEFFALVQDEDRALIDSLCRSLHILNAGTLARREAILLVNFHPGLFTTPNAIRQEVDRMRLAAHEAGLSPGRIACEIREHPQDDPDVLARFADRLRRSGFLIAIDSYTGDDDDLERVRRLRPALVKFESAWIKSFAENSAGLALLRVMIDQFVAEGVRPIFCSIEEPWQIDLCREIGVPLMQGYLLARPEIAPTTFDLHFPETVPFAMSDEPSSGMPSPPAHPQPAAADMQSRRLTRQFGKRGLW